MCIDQQRNGLLNPFSGEDRAARCCQKETMPLIGLIGDLNKASVVFNELVEVLAYVVNCKGNDGVRISHEY